MQKLEKSKYNYYIIRYNGLIPYIFIRVKQRFRILRMQPYTKSLLPYCYDPYTSISDWQGQAHLLCHN